MSNFQVFGKVALGDRPARPYPGIGEDKSQAMPDQLWELVVTCWHQDPLSRPNMTSAVNAIDDMVDDAIIPGSDKTEQALLQKLAKLSREQLPVGDLIYEAYKLHPENAKIQGIVTFFTSDGCDTNAGKGVAADVVQMLQEVSRGARVQK